MNVCPARKGFTLVELLVVLTILGILAAVLFPVFAKVRENGRMSACTSNLHQIGLALQMYRSDDDSAYPPSFDAIDRYTSGHGVFLCPDADQKLASSYQYRIASLLAFDPAEPQETPGKMLQPEPITVLVLCDEHVSDKWRPARALGEFITLRADGSASRIPSNKVVQWSFNGGHWYPPNVPCPANTSTSIWDVFPDELWPPQFEK